MKTIVLISCSSEKESTATTAEQLYTSSLFKKSLAHAKKLNPDAIYILFGRRELSKTNITSYKLREYRITSKRAKTRCAT